MSLYPQQSFEHTLSEISVNRADPCELVRELISNAYDAGARNIRVYPYVQRTGLIFFDDGVGLSMNEKDARNGVLPYVAFFSIGMGTKIPGEQIGYKCQGSKLCFASKRFTVITRCQGESSWRYKTIDNPKQQLNLTYPIDPEATTKPWRLLETKILQGADDRTRPILQSLDEQFFREKFTHGTLIVIEEFETDSYSSYFSVSNPQDNYLFNYIRFWTAHGNVRALTRKKGFSARDVKMFEQVNKSAKPATLKYWITPAGSEDGRLVEIPYGWPYLDMPTAKVDSPAEVRSLNKGRFWVRHATTFHEGGRYYSLILAIDGHRRALDEYDMLGRQRSSRCGIKLSSVRGVLLASNGIAICSYPRLWDHPMLEKEWGILASDLRHYVLIVDGNFELVTNRDALAPSSLAKLRENSFIEKIGSFLQRARDAKDDILAQLIQRLNRETTTHKEEQYITNNNNLKKELPERESFKTDVLGYRLYSPRVGEEHFVGALYTLFAHLVDDKTHGHEHWKRPLTFAAQGIDALAIVDEKKRLSNGNIESIEYKYMFSPDDVFNHPLHIVETIICWKLGECSIGDVIEDEYQYLGDITEEIRDDDQHRLGFIVSRIRHKMETREHDHSVRVLELKSLLTYSFGARFQGVRKRTRRRR